MIPPGVHVEVRSATGAAWSRSPDARETTQGRLDVATARPAGIWRRAIALALDLVIARALLGVGGLAAAVLEPREFVARAFCLSYALVVPPAYFILAHGTTGQTLGKRLVGVRVIGASGEGIGYGRALARLIATALSALLLGAGFLTAAARRDRRALHDLLAGTRVVRVP